jgi:hypothetical protein
MEATTPRYQRDVTAQPDFKDIKGDKNFLYGDGGLDKLFSVFVSIQCSVGLCSNETVHSSYITKWRIF